MNKNQEIENNRIIIGRNSVIEALKSGVNFENIYILRGEHNGSLRVIISMARDMNISIKEIDYKKLDEISNKGNHQGVVAIVSEKEYCTVSEILDYAKSKGEPPFVVIADGIEDPHNLGAIIRTAECAGVHGIIIPKRRSVGITHTVSKTSAGAVEYMKIAKVTNISQAIDELKDNGLWIYGLDMDGQALYKTDLKGAVALVVGSEGKGISRIVREKCDVIISIPMYGKVNSLNASVATGLGVYEVCRQRMT